MTEPTAPPSLASGRRATYTYGHDPVVVDVHLKRTARYEAAFFLPHLQSGMCLLDAGCGPGSITVGLGEVVAPGDVIGLDVDRAVLERARTLAAEHGAGNVQFEAGSVFELPFPDRSFDAVFAHTLLEHVDDPIKALRELRRVLRPGGLIGARDCDWASGIYAPADPLVDQAMTLYARVWQHNGGHPHCGRHLRTFLREAGFARIDTSTSFRWDGTPASSRSFGELLAARFRLSNFIEPAVAMRWSDRATVARISAACESWSRCADAFAAMVMCEAVGWVE